MGETDGDVAAPEERASQDPDDRPSPAPDTLQVPTVKRRKKSPTPLGLRGRSATPIRGRSQTPFTLYLNRRSATPSTWRSITPFLKREDKEKTPFELGHDIKTQLYCNKAVFDKALIMDITEPEVPPVRYITSDMSVIDRAAVMDVSNVEVVYVIEEYEEYTETEEEEEIIEEVKPKKKEKKPKKGRTPRKSSERDSVSQDRTEDSLESDTFEDRERSESAEPEPTEKKKKKPAPKKKLEKKESKLSLKLEMGPGAKASKKMFDQAPPQPPPRPPPKKSKIALQMEEQAKAAKLKAEEEAKKNAEKQKNETFEERQKRLKAEAEEKARIEALEAEARAQQEAEEAAAAAEAAAEAAELSGMEHEGEHEDETGDEEGEHSENESYAEDTDEHEYNEDEEAEGGDEFDENIKDNRRASKVSVDSFTRPDLDEEKWRKIADEEGEEFMLQLRKYSMAKAQSERERDADWQKRREQSRLPHFINFLTDRAVEAGHNVRLACAVDGPDLSVKWFKDGRQLERDNTHRIANNNNILTLEVVNTTQTDSGEYSCVIANTNDEVTSTCIVTVYEVYKDEPSPPTFSLIRDFYHLHDDELTIECHVHGIPRPKVSWQFGAFDIKPSFKFTILEEAHGVYKLLIYRPSNKDSGKYVCKAQNDSGEAQITHTIEVAKNKNFHVHGIFRARDRFSREKEASARQAMDEAMASKKESDRKRAGTVEPRAVGGGRSSVNEPLVSPKNKLKIATQLRDRMALEGATIKLFCNVSGPSPACRWMKDDKWIVVGPNIRNLTEEGRAVLELVNVTAEASGQYKLVAKNEHSEVDTSCFLRVYGAQAEGDEQEPMFALPIRDVYHSSENDLIIDTKVRGNPRPTISWFKDSQTVVLDDRIQQIEHLDGVCELIINKPTPKDGGIYSCEAVNKLGHTKQTHTVVVEQTHPSRRSSGISNQMVEEADSGKAGKAKGKKKEEAAGDGTYERRSRMPDPSPKMSLYFIGNMSNRYLAEGNRVKLQAVIGGPDPTIKWLKDGQNVVFGPKVRNLSRDGLAVLEFTKAAVEDSGVYTLIARNEACEISTTALLHIYQPKVDTDVAPVFVRSIRETYHLNTNELILETGARGEPTPHITWFKDSVEIKSEDRYQIINHTDGTSELIIDSPSDKDSGKYVVKAENSAGKAENLHHVLFKGKETHIADNIHGVFHADKSLLRKKEDERPPSAAGSAAGEEKGGKKGKKGKEEPEEILVIPDVPAKEEKREKRIGIHFKAKATDRCVAEGSRIKLTAYCESNETPAVKWMHDETQVVYSQKVRQSFREGLCVLELVSAQESDSGEYKCIAKDGTGEVVTSCKLEVYKLSDNADSPPTFTRSIKDSYHEKANEVVLNVHVRGLPTPTVTWVKDGVKIEPSDKYQQIYHADGTCELFISSPVPSDSGKYVCQAENRKDKAEITHLVHIEVRKKRASSPGRSIPPIKAPTEETAEEKEKKQKKKKDDEEATSSRREVPPPPDLKKKLYLRNFLSNRTVSAGSNVRWVVNIDGPDPTARWYRNDQMIAFGPKSKLACQDGICYLQLVGVTEEDAGEIKLVVKGSENEVTSTCTLFVYSLKKEEEEVAPVFTVGIKDTYSLNEDELVLDCRVRGYPRPEIQWMKESDMINADEKYRPVSLSDGYCKLIINNPTEKDAGLYSVIARNSVKEEKITHQVDFRGKDRAVLEKTHGFFHRDPNKPHLQNPLGNQTVTPGGTIAIMAEFLPTSSPIDVQWLRSKEPLTGQPNVRTFYDHGVYTLAISNAASEWEGTYTCRATNAYGKLETHANVDIADKGGKAAGPPLFLSRPETEMKIAVGDPFSISFRLQGEPKPKLTLLKGTKDITKTDRVSKEASDDYIRFTVQKSQVADSGTYFVVARNEFGTDRVFVTITVATDKKK